MDFLMAHITARTRESVLWREKSHGALLERPAKRHILFLPSHIASKNRIFLFLYLVQLLPKYSKPLLRKLQCKMSLERMTDNFSILFWVIAVPVSQKTATEAVKNIHFINKRILLEKKRIKEIHKSCMCQKWFRQSGLINLSDLGCHWEH